MMDDKKNGSSTALAPTWMRPATLDDAMVLAKHLSESDMVPDHYRRKPANALLAIMHGQEIGLSPNQALQSIAVINGRTTVWGDAMLALVIAHPKCESVKEEIVKHAQRFAADGKKIAEADTELPPDDWYARVEVKRAGHEPVVRTFSVRDAKRAGLWDKAGPWKNYPQRMLQLRARAFALRDAFPDILKGMAMREEMEDTLPARIEGRRVDDLEERVAQHEAEIMPRATDAAPAGGTDAMGQRWTAMPGEDPDMPRGVVDAPPIDLPKDTAEEAMQPEYDIRGGVRGKYSEQYNEAKLDALVDTVRAAHTPEPTRATAATAVEGGETEFDFGGQHFKTRGCTRNQMATMFKLSPVYNRTHGKGADKALLAELFGFEHRAEMTEAQAGEYITKLQVPAK